MSRFPDPGELATLRERFLYLAQRRFRIPTQVGEDIVQAALLTFLQVRDRYPNADDHPRILVGIFRNKCREHVDACVRADRKDRKVREGLRARGAVHEGGADPEAGAADEGVLGQLVRREDSQAILDVIRGMRPPAREMFRLIAEEGASRKDLIERYGLNKNTLDSRLHAYRGELRQKLAERGIEP